MHRRRRERPSGDRRCRRRRHRRQRDRPHPQRPFRIDQLLEVPCRVLEGPLAVLRQAYEPGLATEGREVSSGNRQNGDDHRRVGNGRRWRYERQLAAADLSQCAGSAVPIGVQERSEVCAPTRPNWDSAYRSRPGEPRPQPGDPFEPCGPDGLPAMKAHPGRFPLVALRSRSSPPLGRCRWAVRRTVPA